MIRNKEKHNSFKTNILISAKSPYGTCGGFSQIASQICIYSVPVNTITQESIIVWLSGYLILYKSLEYIPNTYLLILHLHLNFNMH